MEPIYEKWLQNPGPERGYAVYSYAVLGRNLRDIPFAFHADAPQREEIREKIRKVISQSELAHVLYAVPLLNMPQSARFSLAERGYIQRSTAEKPEEKDLFLSEDGSVFLSVNEKDHLCFGALQPGIAPEIAYQKAEKVEAILGKNLSFAYDEEWGYLSPDLQQLGTGLKAGVCLHLPALCADGDMLPICSSLERVGFSAKPVYPDGDIALGEMYSIENGVTMGIAEKEVLENLRGMVHQLIRREGASRQRRREDARLCDRIYRAMGTLLYARRLSYREAMDLLSKVRLGVSEGFWENIHWPVLDQLVRRIQPATLSLPDLAFSDGADERRAVLIRQAMSREDDDFAV